MHGGGGGQQKTPSCRISDGSWERRSRHLKIRSWWDISDCSQHASEVGWRLANSRFVHKEAQFIVDPLLDQPPVQLLECDVRPTRPSVSVKCVVILTIRCLGKWQMACESCGFSCWSGVLAHCWLKAAERR